MQRVDAARTYLWLMYASKAPEHGLMRAGMEIAELHHAWFPERPARPIDQGRWPTRAQLELLNVVAVYGARSRSELADDLRLSLASVSGRLDVLLRDGLVTEESLPRGACKDVGIVRVTYEGREMVKECLRAVRPELVELTQRQDRRDELALKFSSPADLRARREYARILMKVPS